jgi:hypothetical protein
VHTSNLARTVDLIRRTFKLVADEFGAAWDGAGTAVELLAGGGGAEEAFFAAGVGEGGVPGVPGVVGGGEGALVCAWVGEDGGGGREDGAEDEGGVHCVGEVGVGADGGEEVGELAFGVGEEGRDGVLEGVVGSVNRVGRRRWVVRSLLLLLLGLEVKVDRGRHLVRGPGCRTALICLRYRLLSPCAFPSVRACVPVSPSEQGNCGHIPAPAILSHPHHGRPAHTLAHTARGLQRAAAEHGKRLALS